MEKKIVQDVVPRDSKTIRKVPVPQYREVKINRTITPPTPPKKPRRKSRIGIWIIALLCVIFLIFAVTLLFSSATLKVKPKTQVISINGTYTATKDTKTNALHYDVMSIVKEGSEVTTATGSANVSTKAHGDIVIYNNSAAAQVLAQNTRFENTKGQIYRISKAITVPAKTTKGPGSTTATVYADVAGREYNMSPSDLAGDFTVPGFKGGPKYTLFYARLKTAIAGGESGTVPTADGSSIEEVRAHIRSVLKTEVLKEAFAQKPEGFVLFDNAFRIDYESLPSEPAANGKVAIHERALFSGIIFERKTLSSALAPSLAQNILKSEVTTADIESLVFDLPKNQDFTASSSAAISFGLRGSLKMIYQFSENQLKADLAGKSAQYLPSILSKYPGIESADVTLKPFWKRSFPQNEEKIIIERLTP